MAYGFTALDRQTVGTMGWRDCKEIPRVTKVTTFMGVNPYECV